MLSTDDIIPLDDTTNYEQGDVDIDPQYWDSKWFTHQSYQPEEERIREWHNWIYDEGLSDYNTAIYHNHGLQRTHVAHRGSKDFYEDWYTSDYHIAMGTEERDARFGKAISLTEQAYLQNGYITDVSGHSLGGSLASHVNKNLGNNWWYGKTTTWNAGVSEVAKGSHSHRAAHECNGPSPPVYCGKITHIKQEGDLVSNRTIFDTAVSAFSPFTGFVARNVFGISGKKYDEYGKTVTYNNRSSFADFLGLRPINAHLMGSFRGGYED